MAGLRAKTITEAEAFLRLHITAEEGTGLTGLQEPDSGLTGLQEPDYMSDTDYLDITVPYIYIIL